MRYLSKINRNYLWQLAIILLLVSIAAYFIIRMIVRQDALKNLVTTESLIRDQIRDSGDMPNLYPVVEVERIGRIILNKPKLSRVYIKDETHGNMQSYFEYTNQVEINNIEYSIVVRQSYFESQKLISIIALTSILLLLLAFVFSYILSKRMNKTTWSDFEHNLRAIETFEFGRKSGPQLIDSNIEEFDRLNKVLRKLTQKLEHDYITRKEFTENASHEMQTPLSVAIMNLEEMIQLDLDEEAFKKVLFVMKSLKRLSMLNKSLLILSKIDNRQYLDTERVSINELVMEKLEEFSSLFKSKQLKLSVIHEQDFMADMNRQLIDILLNNLIINAINHNIVSGRIEIRISINELKICNTGNEISLDGENIFDRFTKEKSESFGLGLAIVKEICDAHQMDVTYFYDSMHCFSISSNNRIQSQSK